MLRNACRRRNGSSGAAILGKPVLSTRKHSIHRYVNDSFDALSCRWPRDSNRQYPTLSGYPHRV